MTVTVDHSVHKMGGRRPGALRSDNNARHLISCACNGIRRDGGNVVTGQEAQGANLKMNINALLMTDAGSR